MHPHGRAVPVPWFPPVHPRPVSQQGGWQLRHQQQVQTAPSVRSQGRVGLFGCSPPQRSEGSAPSTGITGKAPPFPAGGFVVFSLSEDYTALSFLRVGPV